ncbi:S1/P1 nuclease [Oxalobacteraceae bacterium]|nr:S1/P1 nuclease [Oxalobacteraceae bacterium]
MKILSSAVLCGIALAAPVAALAWGPQGHQQVGALADQLIQGSEAQKQVQRILGGLSLQTVSVWADCAKGVGTADDIVFRYVDKSADFPECKPFQGADEARRFESYVQRNWKQCGTAHGGEQCHKQYHYTDVSNFHYSYQDGYVGTRGSDVVHALAAAAAYLSGKTATSPFSFADEKEALMLLSHYVGDLHQPLHVTSVYLDIGGELVNPDIQGYRNGNDTGGGNLLIDAGMPTGDQKTLHALWDAIPENLMVNGKDARSLLAQARNTPVTKGEAESWAARWASETMFGGRAAFSGLEFDVRPNSRGMGPDVGQRWDVLGVDEAYRKKADAIKSEQLARAGARLAQLLKKIWP